jgi:hemoglobin-like flavoprotein
LWHQNIVLIIYRSIDDADGPKIADSFYEHLFKDYNKVDNIGPDMTQATRALYHAVAKLHSENVSFARWVPFIHLGR